MDVYGDLNRILVSLFNDLIDIEEKALIVDEFKDISINDMHIIEAIGTGEPKNMSTVAKAIDVTVGTLTIGINGLVKKGYVIRERGTADRRVVYISLTDKGLRAYRHHEQFHKNMALSIMDRLDEDEAVVLVRSLNKMTDYFNNLKVHDK
ncbi:MAG: MarR family transcriptional regulator [Lachnospiraceae bacterium]|uniref:MarR family winged helix-turn-helix transcriptional regulator n=1 Tax=Falcatimonas sp. MSJ-15 TaxID=2841515 RepID=UPI001C11AEE8|nr:MarR family transcriptional regulator [Lachnospiraceae bacterium]MBU5470519.1 MarR family transcriptional regulator [Falcatimonas sp. MSJ-15]